jgi:hypothetical protein
VDFILEKIVRVFSIISSAPVHTSVFSSCSSSDAVVSFPFGEGGGDVDDVKSSLSPVN